MKRLFVIYDSLENKISYYLLACFLIALPFDHFYSEWLLILFCVHTLIHLKKGKLAALKNKNTWIISSLFFLTVAAIVFSNYKSDGLKDSTHQLGILLFPFFLSLTNLNIHKYKLALLEIFSFTCTLTILYLFIHAIRIIHYFHLSYFSLVSSIFINQKFSAPIGLHATYLSMYVSLSICIFLYLLFSKKYFKNYTYLFCIVTLLAGLLQLSSRSVIIATAVIIIFVIPFLLLHSRQRFLFLATSLAISLSVFLVVTQIDSLRKRYITDLENDLSDYTNPGDQSESRMLRWGLEWQLIQQSPMIGYGSGAEINILKDKYFENKFYKSYLVELNAHSQYMSFLLKAGIPGLLFFLYVLYYGFSNAIKRKDFIFLSFMIILVIVSVSENLLDLNKGVFFYAFFYSLFLLPVPNDEVRKLK
ncbi:MAG: O-antigen ligase family protein [Ginsengibacter sp.]